MKSILLILFLTVSSIFCYSQLGNKEGKNITNGSNFGFIRGDHLPDSFLKSQNKTINYSNINGSPYINNNQKSKNDKPTGRLFDVNKTELGTFFMRYNAYTDNIEISKLEDGINYFLLKKKTNSWYIELGDSKYGIFNYYKENKFSVGYFKIAYQELNKRHSLLIKESIIFIDEKKEDNAFVTSTPPQFKRIKNVFYLKTGESLTKLPLKKKKFIQFFNDKSKIILNYIKDNKLKIFKENDLIKIIKYYNTL